MPFPGPASTARGRQLINICVGSSPQSHLDFQSWGRDLGVWGPLSRGEAVSGPGHSRVTRVPQPWSPPPSQGRRCPIPHTFLSVQAAHRDGAAQGPARSLAPTGGSWLPGALGPASRATRAPGRGVSGIRVLQHPGCAQGASTRLTPYSTGPLTSSGGSTPQGRRRAPQTAPGASRGSLLHETSENRHSLGQAATDGDPGPLRPPPGPQRSQEQQ